MLVLSRKVGQELVIGDNIRVIVSRVAGNRVSLGIQAPDSVHVIRAELQEIRDEFAVESFPERTDLKTRVASRRDSSTTRQPTRLNLSTELSSAGLTVSGIR
jgi:carbon storage regulator